MANRTAEPKPAGEDILHLAAIGIWFTDNDGLAATLRRLADEAEDGGINPSQPADIAGMRFNPGGGGPCAPTQVEVTFSLVPPRRWPPEPGFAKGTPGV